MVDQAKSCRNFTDALTAHILYHSINSSVTGHTKPWREDLGELSQVTTVTEEMDRNFYHLQHTNCCLILWHWECSKEMSRRLSWIPKRCSYLCGGDRGDRSQGLKSKWPSCPPPDIPNIFLFSPPSLTHVWYSSNIDSFASICSLVVNNVAV